MKIFVLIGVLLAGVASVRAQENLLKNPTMEIDQASETIPGWKLAPRQTVIENSAENLPDGATTSLVLTVGEVSESDGQLVQRMKVAPGDGLTCTVSGWLMSEVHGAAYLQVKLYKDGSEIQRINLGSSGSQWKKVSGSIDLEKADAMEVLCRWHQQARNEGKRVYFASIAVTEKEG